MGWLVITDIKMKHGLHYEKYTVWGEVSTFITFALLTQCSVEKYLAESIFKYNNSGSIRCLFGNIGLAKRASFMFQWAFLCELTLTLLFWSFNLFVCTDLSKMSYEEIRAKLYYDVIQDVDNYNHVIPILLLSVEFMVNNIDFTWCQLVITVFLNVMYICLQYMYCTNTHKIIYKGIDWNENT